MSSLGYAILMLVAGFGIPIGATLNGVLGQKLQSTTLATTVLFVVGLLISVIVLIFTGGLPKSLPRDVPLYLFLGGGSVIFYVLSITWVAPRFGVGNAISFVLLGQLISMTLIDHFQLFGVQHFPITVGRVMGLVLMVSGIFLVVRRV
jgi:bacterial/archaeal transporter family-2 protein